MSYDLRKAIEVLKANPGQYIESNEPVECHAEISGIYRYIGAGGTVPRPTQEGPAMMFTNVNGHQDSKVLIGTLASRKRVALMLGTASERLGFLLKDSVADAIDPVVVGKDKAVCQEVVYNATDPGFDIRKIVPAPTNTPEDAGPYVTMGVCYGEDPETGVSDVTIHRLCLQSEDEMSMWITPGARHLGTMFEKAEKAGQEWPISVSIGVDPAINVASGFEPPTTPYGFNELNIAGAIRGEAVELTNCVNIDTKCIANAEYVIEGVMLPGVRVQEDKNSGTGKAMPEFPGYTGGAAPAVPVIKVKTVTHRKNPILQTCIGPSEEHVSMAGIPTEASILGMVEKAMPGRLINVYAASPGGGKYMAVLQFKKSVPSDEGRQRQAALLAFSAFPELKHVFLVDDDVDPFDMNDVIWAMNTRFQGNLDTVFIPGVRCHPLDPSETPEYSPTIADRGISCKTIFDCTVPYKMKDKFERSKFLELDPKKYAPSLFE